MSTTRCEASSAQEADETAVANDPVQILNAEALAPAAILDFPLACSDRDLYRLLFAWRKMDIGTILEV